MAEKEDTTTPASAQQAVIAINKISQNLTTGMLALNASNLTTGTVPAARMPALTGDVTSTVGTVATTIAAGVVTNSKMAAGAAVANIGYTPANVAGDTFTGSTGVSFNGVASMFVNSANAAADTGKWYLRVSNSDGSLSFDAATDALSYTSAASVQRSSGTPTYWDFKYPVAFTGSYLNATTTTGSSGYGVRVNSGVMESKDSGGVWAPIITYYVALTSANTLTSTTSAQPIFDGGGGPTNGKITLPAGTYFFDCMAFVSSLSASAHTIYFGFGGTATISSAHWMGTSVEGSSAFSLNSTIATARQIGGTGATATTIYFKLGGSFHVSSSGTVIPQITQATNAAAASVAVDSYFTCKQAGGASDAYVGPWS